jgi:Na+/H+ antiporter NhaC
MYIYIYIYIYIHIDGLEMCSKLVEEIKRVQGCDDILYLIAAVDQVPYITICVLWYMHINVCAYTHLY